MLTKQIKIIDVILPFKNIPVLYEDSFLKEALELMCKFKIGVCFCIKKDKTLIGILTDGDIRRKILSVQKPMAALLNDDLYLHINKNPKKIRYNENIKKVTKLMEKNLIWDLPVVDNKNKLLGIIHLHSIVKLLIKKK